MTSIVRETDYWITGDDHLLLMHRIPRTDQKSSCEFCVGEAFVNEKGYWEVRIGVVTDLSESPNQILVGISDSRTVALEVLWEQRHLMYWGYYQ